MKITAVEAARLSRAHAQLGVREGGHRRGRPLRLGRSDARMAHAGRGRSDRRPRGADRRRGPDADRAPLADDVPPALLARHGIVRATAIAGIDIALWDIVGKVHGVPCHRLWGGRVRDTFGRTATSAAGGWRTSTRRDEPQRFGDLARQAVEDGFTAFKSMAVPPTMPIEGLAPLGTPSAAVAAMREAVGEQIDIMVDCHARPSPAMGLKFAKALDPYGLYFFEEPCWPERGGDIAEIRRRCYANCDRRAPGRHLTAFRELFEAAAPAISVSPTSPTAVASPTPGESPHWPMPTKSRSLRTTRKARSHRRLDRVRPLPRPATSSANPFTPTFPGAQRSLRRRIESTPTA